MATNTPSQKIYSSKTVFVAIGAVLVVMAGFMFICKQLGVLNPRATWDLEFQNLRTLILDAHISGRCANGEDAAEADVNQHLTFYAGSQIAVRQGSPWQLGCLENQELNGKPVIMVRLFPKDSTGQDTGRNRDVTFAMFPIANRQLQKTFKFSRGSFLWHAYSWDRQGTSFVVTNENEIPGRDQLDLIAANYLNDYFVLAVGAVSHSELAVAVSEAFSFYHEDFIRTF